MSKIQNSHKLRLQLRFNPLTPGTFCKKCVFWTFWWFLRWILAKLPLIRLKMRLQHNSLPFWPPASRLSALWLWHAQKSKFCDFWVFGRESDLRLKAFRFLEFFFRPSFFSFSPVFAAMIHLLLGLLAAKKLLRKCHRDG